MIIKKDMINYYYIFYYIKTASQPIKKKYIKKKI